MFTIFKMMQTQLFATINYKCHVYGVQGMKLSVRTRACEQRSLKRKRQPHLVVSSFSLLKPSRMKCVIPSTKWGFANAARTYIIHMAHIDNLSAMSTKDFTSRKDFQAPGNTQLSRKLNSHKPSVIFMMTPKVQRNANNILVIL